MTECPAQTAQTDVDTETPFIHGVEGIFYLGFGLKDTVTCLCRITGEVFLPISRRHLKFITLPLGLECLHHETVSESTSYQPKSFSLYSEL